MRRGEKACGVLITAVNPDSFNKTVLVDILLRALNILETIVDALDRELVDAFAVAQGVEPGTNLLRVTARAIWVFGEKITSGMSIEIEKARRKGQLIRYFTETCEEVRR